MYRASRAKLFMVGACERLGFSLCGGNKQKYFYYRGRSRYLAWYLFREIQLDNERRRERKRGYERRCLKRAAVAVEFTIGASSADRETSQTGHRKKERKSKGFVISRNGIVKASIYEKDHFTFALSVKH